MKTGINTERVECFQERVNASIHEDLSELKPVLEVLVYRFHISAIVNNAAMNIDCMYLLELVFLFSSSIYFEVE